MEAIMHPTDYDISRLIVQIQDLVAATHSLDLSFNICSCRLYSNSPELLARLRTHYQAFETHVAAPDYLLVALDTPPFIVDGAYDIRLDGDITLTIPGDVADRLDGRLTHDRRTGMLALRDRDRYLIMGPGCQHPESIVAFIYELYQAWKLDTARTSLEAAAELV